MLNETTVPAEEKCGKPAEAFIPRLGMSLACVLPAGHVGDCQPGGTCFIHSQAYVGLQCPLCFPSEPGIKDAAAKWAFYSTSSPGTPATPLNDSARVIDLTLENAALRSALHGAQTDLALTRWQQNIQWTELTKLRDRLQEYERASVWEDTPTAHPDIKRRLHMGYSRKDSVTAKEALLFAGHTLSFLTPDSVYDLLTRKFDPPYEEREVREATAEMIASGELVLNADRQLVVTPDISGTSEVQS